MPKRTAVDRGTTGRVASRLAKKIPSGFLKYLDPNEVDRPPSGESWAHEIKWDGYRAQAHLTAGRATVYTRNGNDWTARFGPIAKAVELLPARTAILDGEAVAIDRKGAADFHELRRQLGQAHGRIIYKAFDLLWLDGEDMRPLAWSERKRRLLFRPLARALMPRVFQKLTRSRRGRGLTPWWADMGHRPILASAIDVRPDSSPPA
jgi:bifunctional non-homologous end joining protein LigD